MTDNPGTQRLDALLSQPVIDADELIAEVERSGPNVDILERLVDQHGRSRDVKLVQAISFLLARSMWDLTPRNERLNATVLGLLRSAGRTLDPNTLINMSTAVQVLSALGLLRARAPRDREVMGRFLLRMLRHRDIVVRGCALVMLGHLVADATLEPAVTPDTLTAIRSAVRRIADREGLEFAVELTDLQGFIADASAG